MSTFDVVVVGGGPAGMMAAARAAQYGARTVLLEKNRELGRKLMITGRGRCNFAHDQEDPELLSKDYRRRGEFLLPALRTFGAKETAAFFLRRGVVSTHERGRRLYPREGQDASSVVNALWTALKDGGVQVLRGIEVRSLDILGGKVRRVTTGREEIEGRAFILATGGLSFPHTGSTGDGYKLAQQAGHTLVEPVPSLVSLVSHDPDCKKMMGLALKNVTLTLFEDGKDIFEEQGEMLFTHFGISGPLTLSASSHLGDMKKHKYHAEIDLKPALSEEQLYDRITRDFALLANHAAQGALVKLLPASMQPVMVARWGIDPATKANQITREQKRELVRLMKHWNVPIDARGDLAHAVITSGGVSVREVDPRTMQSKKALGLYFAGEVLDVDAYTGGYNLQIAFCTAQSFARNLD